MNLEKVHEFLSRVPIQVWIYLITWLCAEVLIYTTILLANKFNLVDRPDFKRKIHTTPIPTLGGVPIFFAFLAGIMIAPEKDLVYIMYPLIGAFICMILGLIDDLKPLSAVIKLVVLFVVTYAISNFGSVEEGNAVIARLAPWAWLNLAISLIWIVGMMSAINSLDNMDGLASGITAIASAFIFIIAWNFWHRGLSFFSVALCAASLTFLRYNFFRKRAAIFLGDNGSYFIGYALACMVMMGAWTDPRATEGISEAERVLKALMVPPLLLGVPIFDIVTATVLRLVNKEVKTVKEAIVYCGKDHTSHRLVALGMSNKEAVTTLWGLGVALGVVSLVIQDSDRWELYVPLFFVTLAGLVFFAVILNKAKVYDHQIEKAQSD